MERLNQHLAIHSCIELALRVVTELRALPQGRGHLCSLVTMTIDELPTLTIRAIGDRFVSAAWSDPKWIGEGDIACVVTKRTEFVWGRVTDVNTAARTCVFTPESEDALQELRLGDSYPQLDGYWGERAALVFDGSKVWKERQFEPTDAVRYRDDHVLGPISGKVPPGGEVVQGGWDHEHCEICWEKISRQANPIAMFAEPHHWLCCACYLRFVVPRSLEFISTATSETNDESTKTA